jgi:hypothetical protein
MSEIILDMWLYTHHTSALLAKKSDNINKVSPILLPLQTLHIKSTTGLLHEGIFHVGGLIKPAIFDSLPWAYVMCNWAQILVWWRH